MPSQTTELNSLAGALGSIIGYLGAEAAEPYLFERLLWPQRFYNAHSVTTFLGSALLMPMGGPLHRAALEVLDRFRKKGLYKGAQRGHMLGTAFYANTGLRFHFHGYNGPDHDSEIRNGLWVNVLRSLRNHDLGCDQLGNKGADVETQETETRRAVQMVHHLQLSVPDEPKSKGIKVFCEDNISLATPFIMLASEVSAIGCALLIVLAEQRCFWFAAYMCLPLVLKLLSIVCCVRREPATRSIRSTYGPDILIEVDDYDHGFPLISGPEEIVRQFFRHWGHPIRESRLDRAREKMSMALIFGFVFTFPIGLLSMLWVSNTVQIVWLSYQMFVIVVMHFNRLIGYEGPGRLEDTMAHELATRGKLLLHSKHGGTIMAELTAYPVSRIREGREKVKEIARDFSAKVELKRNDSNMSETSTLAPSTEKSTM
ncbi:hypothetical protein H2200_002321 [Cladophialophora chaetospira]|uniref:Uncharacterized protein n=1 Tax=Cladophialophora chaetospira TaxID=386627 RepID=A0AA38XIN8_9EURO|nr:hypothetical protein H2200_002321 [Cladophialophora chaetospira]